MLELASIGREAQQMDEEDTQLAIECAMRGEDVPLLTRMERVRSIIEGGVGWDAGSPTRGNSYSNSNSNLHSRTSSYSATHDAEGDERTPRPRTRSVEGRAVMFANRINALSLGLTRLRAFKARQGEVFKVLSGVGLN